MKKHFNILHLKKVPMITLFNVSYTTNDNKRLLTIVNDHDEKFNKTNIYTIQTKFLNDAQK